VYCLIVEAANSSASILQSADKLIHPLGGQRGLGSNVTCSSGTEAQSRFDGGGEALHHCSE